MKILFGCAVVLVLAAPTFAQDATVVAFAGSEEFGDHLTASGQPVYRFSADTRASGDQQAQVACTDEECAEAWPLVTTSGAPQAGEGIDASLLGTAEHDGELVVTYDGWPLYHFIRDENADGPQGDGIESFGGVWHLVAPTAPEQDADVSAGETMFAEACAQCHGRTGRGMASFPALTGRDAEYIASRLVQYRAGERIGPNSPLMWAVATGLSDQDIANLAAHISMNFQ